MNVKRIAMTRKIEDKEVKNLKAAEIVKMYEFANRCLLNKHMTHDREVLIHNVEILETAYWTVVDELEDLW